MNSNIEQAVDVADNKVASKMMSVAAGIIN